MSLLPDLLLRLKRIERGLSFQDVHRAFELQGNILAHLGKKFLYRFDFGC